MVRRGRPVKKPEVVLPRLTLGLVRDTLEVMLENMGMSEACIIDCMTTTKDLQRSQIDQLKQALKLAVDMGLMTHREGRYMFTMENLENLLTHEHGDSDYDEADRPGPSTGGLSLSVIGRASLISQAPVQATRKKRPQMVTSANPATPPKRRRLQTLRRPSLRASGPFTPVSSPASSRASSVGNAYTGFRDPRRGGGGKQPTKKQAMRLPGVEPGGFAGKRRRGRPSTCAERDHDVDAPVVSHQRLETKKKSSKSSCHTDDTEGEAPPSQPPSLPSKRTKSDTSVGSSHASSGGGSKGKSRGRAGPSIQRGVVRQTNTAAILHEYLSNSGARILADSASSHTDSTAESEVGGPTRRERPLKDEPSASSIESKKSSLSKVSSKTSCTTENSSKEGKTTTLMKPRGRKPKPKDSASSLGSSKSKASSYSTDDKDDGNTKAETTPEAQRSTSTATVKSKRSTTSSAGKKSRAASRASSKASTVGSRKSKKEAEAATTQAPPPADQAERRMRRSATRFLGAASMVNIDEEEESETRSLHDFYT